jgi:hypothetical protein
LTVETTPELVAEVIELSGCREKRQRLLPAVAVVYFVLGLCLFDLRRGPLASEGMAGTSAFGLRLCALKTEAARQAGIDPDRVSFTVTVRIARDHAAAIRPSGRGHARRDAIRDILADLLPSRRDRQCERVKKPPRNTFPARKRGQTPSASNASYTIKITKKAALPASTP